MMVAILIMTLLAFDTLWLKEKGESAAPPNRGIDAQARGDTTDPLTGNHHF
jgi:hypothetical protein